MSDFIGRSIGRYHILEQLGEGGMATVYKAFDTRLEANVAVKIIRAEDLPPSAKERSINRFEREAKALARLTHPNIVKVTDYGEIDGKPYLVMPFLPGGTLKKMLTGQPMPWREALRLLIPIARALDYAHRQGMIHRDVKPSNILITEDGEPMLTDFGIAKIIDDEATVDLTGTNATVGTPEYMAPEQVTSKTVDRRADIYSLGVVLYELVTGRKPFQADTPLAVLLKSASEALPPPRQFVRGIPENVEKMIFKALAKKPEDRYPEMAAFTVAMENLLAGQTTPFQLDAKPAANLPSPIGVQRKRWIPIAILAIFLVIGLIVVLAVVVGGGILKTLGQAQRLQTLLPTASQVQTVATIPTFTLEPSLTYTPTPAGLFYNNPTAGISLTYPLTWKYSKSGDASSGFVIYFVSSVDILTNGISNGALFEINTAPKTGDFSFNVNANSIEEVINSIANDPSSNLIQGQNLHTFTLSGYPAASGVYLRSDSVAQLTIYLVAVLRNDHVIEIISGCPQADWAKYQPIFDSILHSMVIVAP